MGAARSPDLVPGLFLIRSHGLAFDHFEGVDVPFTARKVVAENGGGFLCLIVEANSVIGFRETVQGLWHMGSSFKIIDDNLPEGRVNFIQEWSNVIGFNKRNDEIKQNHDATKLNGAIFNVIIDSLGKAESIEGNNDVAKEMIDESESFSGIFGSDNYLYPFGSDSLRQVGDVWSYTNDKELEARTGSDGYSGIQKNVTTVTFKKIKVKKGQEIAILKIKMISSDEGTESSWDEIYDVKTVGEFKGTAQYNLTAGRMRQFKASGSMKGSRTKLSNDKTYQYIMNMDMKMKRKR